MELVPDHNRAESRAIEEVIRVRFSGVETEAPGLTRDERLVQTFHRPASNGRLIQACECGEMPEVNVEGGNMPKYDVDPAKVEVGTDTTKVVTPDVDIKPQTTTN